MPRYAPDALEHVAAHITDDNGNSLDFAGGLEVINNGGTVSVPGVSDLSGNESVTDYAYLMLMELRAIRIGIQRLLELNEDDTDLLEMGMAETDSDAA